MPGQPKISHRLSVITAYQISIDYCELLNTTVAQGSVTQQLRSAGTFTATLVQVWFWVLPAHTCFCRSRGLNCFKSAESWFRLTGFQQCSFHCH